MDLPSAPPPLRWVATEHKIGLGVAARLLTVAVMLKAAVEVRTRFDDDTSAPGLSLLVIVALICIMIHLIALAGGLWSSRRIGFDRANQIVVVIAERRRTRKERDL